MEAQIAIILKQAEEGTLTTEVCRKAKISDATSSPSNGVQFKTTAIQGKRRLPSKRNPRMPSTAFVPGVSLSMNVLGCDL